MTVTAARDARREARKAMRKVAAPVAVLTVSHEGRVHGTTVSTLVGVSPTELIIGVSLRSGSLLGGLAVAAGRFTVNLLSGGQGGLARWFADRDRPQGPAQFAGVPWTSAGGDGAPLIDGALAHLECRLVRSIPVADHELLLGEVVDAVAGTGDPLFSFAGDLCAGALRTVPGSGDGTRNSNHRNPMEGTTR
ncbi:flavin reductase family protein [Microbispora sp. NPDC049125]|uniref:flavin reductase family protein n=1 Tax=Microbispora sp. NPDC049125 TaxID=3154929 RepID=UPI00346670C7